MTLLLMIGVYVVAFSVYTMLMWISIIFIDRVFVTEKWYWEALTFLLGVFLVFLELTYLFV